MSGSDCVHQDALRDADHVAVRLGVTKRQVYKLVESGKLGHFKLGYRTLRISDAQIERFLASREVAA